jgi:uncharacterized membrane protein YeiH
MQVSDFIYYLDLIGTFVFAISGTLLAVEKRFDIVGAFVIGLVTALGGGTTRDILIGASPVAWMTDLNYLFCVPIAMVCCYLFYDQILQLRRSLFLFDAIGIGIFTILGIQKVLSMGLSPIIALIMGIVSAVFGGIVRDVLTNEVPLIFRKEIYASACLIGGLSFLLISKTSLPTDLISFISVILVILIRILAVRYKWETPFRPKGVSK